MNYLLDTHVWLWLEEDATRLNEDAAKALRKSGSRLYLSPVSIWEAVVLQRKGKLQMRRSLEAIVGDIDSSGNPEWAPVTAAVALEVGRISFAHHDPADNLIAATARVDDLTLVTADQKLLSLPGLKCLPA